MPSFQPITYSNNGPFINRAFITMLEYMNGRWRLEKEYCQTLEIFEKLQQEKDPTPYFDVALNQINISTNIVKGQIENIPESGPLIVLANHPFGVIDGLITGSIVYQRRQDFQILANHALNAAEPMQKWLIPLDDAGTKKAEAANRPAIMKAMRYLQKGGCLCLFPAGRVARPEKWGAPVDDYQWQEFAARMILSACKSNLPLKILPMFFEGQNSAIFHLSHILRLMPLRRALIVSEALKKRGQEMPVHIGNAIGLDMLTDGNDSKKLTEFLHSIVFDLQPHPVYFPANKQPATHIKPL